METHAEYHYNNPLPVCGVIFGRMADVIVQPPETSIRVVKQDMDAEIKKPKATAKPKRARSPGVQTSIDRMIQARANRFRPAMKGKGWMTAMKIADKIQTSDDTARTVLKRMVRDGQVEFWKKSHKEAFYRWIEKAKT